MCQLQGSIRDHIWELVLLLATLRGGEKHGPISWGRGGGVLLPLWCPNDSLPALGLQRSACSARPAELARPNWDTASSRSYRYITSGIQHRASTGKSTQRIRLAFLEYIYRACPRSKTYDASDGGSMPGCIPGGFWFIAYLVAFGGGHTLMCRGKLWTGGMTINHDSSQLILV